jgi:hypothetical protein
MRTVSDPLQLAAEWPRWPREGLDCKTALVIQSGESRQGEDG